MVELGCEALTSVAKRWIEGMRPDKRDRNVRMEYVGHAVGKAEES